MGARGADLGAGARSLDQPPADGTAGYPTEASAALGAVAPQPSEPDLGDKPGLVSEACCTRAPAQLAFKLKYPGPIGRRVLQFTWEPRKSWRSYLREKRLIETWVQHRSYDEGTRKKIRLGDEPYPGQIVVLR
jgi:hypothetical protein